MKIGKRVEALVKTLQSVADWATRLEPQGISLRFLNYKKDGDGDFDNLADLEKIKDMVHYAQPHGPTKLGTILEEKILNPIALKATRERLKKPLIGVIITDGEVGLPTI
jgi:hypothetical protein